MKQRNKDLSNMLDNNIQHSENSNNVIEINRPAVTEEILRTRYSAPVKLPRESFNFKRKFLSTLCPLGLSLQPYDLNAFLRDIISGLTVACIRLPQGLAYGALATVPPIHGLYTELFSCLAYSLFASSRHNSVGTFAVVALMTGAMVDEYIPKEYLSLPSNSTELQNKQIEYVYSATSLIGIIQFLFGLFQVGRLSVLLPPHVVESFTTGAAFYVLTSQVKVMLGLGPDHVPRNMRAGGLFVTWSNIIVEAEHSLTSSILVSICCIIFLLIVKEIQSRYQKELNNLPIPGELMLSLLARCCVHFGRTAPKSFPLLARYHVVYQFQYYQMYHCGPHY